MGFWDYLTGKGWTPPAVARPVATKVAAPVPKTLPVVNPSSYSDRFVSFMPFVFEHENVYAKGHSGDDRYVVTENVDGDPGGLTKFGIDQASQPHVNIAALTKEHATQIYWDSYWNKNHCDSLPEGMGEAHMDCCVNNGSGRAVIILAQSKTAAEYIKNNEDFYHRLVDQKPKFQKFLKGWIQRKEDLKKWLKLV